MKYYGRLFGEERGKRTRYWDTGKTGKDWENIETERDTIKERMMAINGDASAIRDEWLATQPEGIRLVITNIRRLSQSLDNVNVEASVPMTHSDTLKPQ